MAFTTEMLNELGLDKDQVKGVMKLHGEDMTDMKQQIATAEAERDSAKSLSDDMTKQLDSVKKQAEKGSDLETQVTELQSQLKQSQADADAKLTATHKQYEIESALTKAGARNSKAVQALLDVEKVTYEDGKLNGLADQLDAIKAENDYLFTGQEAPKQGVQAFPKGNPSNGKADPIDLSKMSYKEQITLKQDNPEAYEAALKNGEE